MAALFHSSSSMKAIWIGRSIPYAPHQMSKMRSNFKIKTRLSTKPMQFRIEKLFLTGYNVDMQELA